MDQYTVAQLPPEARPIAERMEAGQMLGAARNIDAILKILAIVARHSSPGSASEVQQAAEYFARTRGEETAAVGNTLAMFQSGLPHDDLLPWVEAFGEEIARLQTEWLEEVAEKALMVLSSATVIVAYDYSSTVAEILRRKCADDGSNLEILVPESRTLDGGRPYIEALAGLDARLTFLSDGAIAPMVARADAVLEGVETLSEDGSFFNTIGSLTTAVCARHYGVPYYAATSLIKVARGVDPHQLQAGSPRRFADTYGPIDPADTTYVENELVPAELVTGVVTERGLLAPDEVREATEAFFESTSLGSVL